MKRILALLLAALFGFATLQAAEGADNFTLKTVDGKALHVQGLPNGMLFKELKGKVVFLEFWGTHCPPCRISIPHYIELQKKYKDKMAMVAVEVQATPTEALKAFVKAKGINYDVVSDSDAPNFTDYVMLRTGWKGSIPYLIILDQKGNFVTGQVGLLSQKALEGVIQELDKLQKKTPSTAKAAPTAASETNASKK